MNLSPLRLVDGYPPLEDCALIGDGATSALVCRDGAIVWLCVPRFDSDALFCRLLDSTRGGAFTVAPLEARASRQRYEEDTGIVVTEVEDADGSAVRIVDALTLEHGADLTEDAAMGRAELVRVVTGLRGRTRLLIHLDPRGGASATRDAHGVRVRARERPDLDLRLDATVPLDGLRSVIDIDAGQTVEIALRWGGRSPHDAAPAAALEGTRAAWRRWVQHIEYEGPQAWLVRRSAIALKLLDFFETGSIVAAPTSSLPELIGGARNWDYRYSWIRDAAFTVYALHRIGLRDEAAGFLAWAMRAAEHGGRPHVLYDLDGRRPPAEREDPLLEGYRGSRPVRWGNAAADQRQHDVYGEILDCAFQWRRYGRIDEVLWPRLRDLVEAAGREWHEPDHGIWEVRTSGRVFTYSAALCQVALDRGARIAGELGLADDATAWGAAAERIRQTILDEAWDPDANALTEHLGGGGLDASLLALPLRRVIDARHPKMVATTAAISERLGAGNGLVYRYLPHESPDGLPGHEGAFLLCSFWLVDNLAYQGRFDEAMTMYDSLCARAGGLGLLPEQVDPATGAFLGNYPQAFSHVGVISSGVNLARALRRQEAQ